MTPEVDVAMLPFMFVCTFVCGFLFNTCTDKKRIEQLEDQIDCLEYELSDAEFRLKKLAASLKTAEEES